MFLDFMENEDCIQQKSKISEHASNDACIFCKIAQGEIKSNLVYDPKNKFFVL